MKSLREKLKPCPFCGGVAELKSTMGWYWVICKRGLCGASLNSRRKEARAISVWNKRS